ncbi:hypothetical protein FRC05_005518 [Tulasnella sp. 425]|nr:hypothetical protein FRC05_005518 [Tulasnella sp. 425]
MSLSGPNLLDADPFGFGRFQNTPEGKVIVLWDYENCPVPKGISGLSAVRNIREAALKFGSIDQFEAYCDWSNKASTGIRDDLSISGVKLRDCPTKGWIGTVDKAIVVDMMVYALERPRTTTVLLISGDKDHAYAISTLRNRGYPVKLVAPTGTLYPGLQVFADLLDWNSIFRSDPSPTELVDLTGLAGDEDEEEEEEDGETSEDSEDEVEEEMEADETAQVQVGVEPEVEGIFQLQVEAEKKVQVLVETDDEGDSGEPALPTPPQSESVATLATAEVLPMWTPAEPALPSKVVPLEPLSALAQQRQEERPQAPRLLSPSPSTGRQVTPPSSFGGSSQPGFGPSSIQKPQTVAPSYGGASNQPGLGASSTQEPKTVPPSYGGRSSQPGSGPSPVQKPQTVPPSYGGGSNQPGLGASSVQQPKTVPPSNAGASSQPGLKASSVQQPKTVPPSNAGGSSQPGSGPSVAQQPARYVPPKFVHLVRELEVLKAEGVRAPGWGSLCDRVVKRCPTVLKAAGVNRWKEYVLLAEKEGVVALTGKSGGKDTVSLKI